MEVNTYLTPAQREILGRAKVGVAGLGGLGQAKTMLIKALAETGIPVVAASGLAGFGNSNAIRLRKVNEKPYLAGDLVSGISPELAPASPRVGIAAAMEANTVAILLGLEVLSGISSRRIRWRDDTS